MSRSPFQFPHDYSRRDVEDLAEKISPRLKEPQGGWSGGTRFDHACSIAADILRAGYRLTEQP